MKAIRIAALGVALVVGSATFAQAQGAGGGMGGGRGAGRGNMLMMGIDSTLSADQKAKIDGITAKYAPETAAIREMMQTDREGAMKKRVELQGKMNPEIRSVLSEAQQKMFDKNMEEMAKRMAMPRPAGTPEL